MTVNDYNTVTQESLHHTDPRNTGIARASSDDHLILLIETGALEDIENIVYIEFRQAKRQDGTCKVGMTAVVEILACIPTTHS